MTITNYELRVTKRKKSSCLSKTDTDKCPESDNLSGQCRMYCCVDIVIVVIVSEITAACRCRDAMLRILSWHTSVLISIKTNLYLIHFQLLIFNFQLLKYSVDI
jgi:hypothetical protein